VGTTVVQLSSQQAADFADFLETHQLDEPLREQGILSCTWLRTQVEPILLDLSLLAHATLDAYYWLKDRWCPLSMGCRVASCSEPLLSALLFHYQGCRLPEQQYALIAASSIEVSVALEILHDAPTLLQLEL